MKKLEISSSPFRTKVVISKDFAGKKIIQSEMVDKNNDDLRNGRRSRGVSPHSSDNSDGSDSEGEQIELSYFLVSFIKRCIIRKPHLFSCF